VGEYYPKDIAGVQKKISSQLLIVVLSGADNDDD
jgi:hypothetical protein